MSFAPRQQIQVLHVDDEPDFADLAATFLERESDRFAVETARSADEGLKIINDRPPDCVVSDYNMPGMDGLEFLQTVRETNPDLPFILYTGKGSEAVASDAIAADVTDYLQKGTGSEQYELLANRIRNAVQARRDAERATRQEQLMRLTEFTGDTGGFELDRESDTILLTAGTRRIIGRPDQDKISLQEAIELFHPDDREDIQQTLNRTFERDEEIHKTWRLQPGDGDERLLDVTIIPVVENGEVTKLRGAGHDITERKEFEQQLQRNNRRFEALFNDPNLLVGLLEPAGTLIDVNETAMEYIDAGRDDLINEPFWTTPWWSAEIQPVIREKIEQAATGQYVEYEADLAQPDGGQYSVTGMIRPVTNDSGDVTSLIVSARDVTERVRRERILDAVLEHTTVPMFLKNRDGEYILVNQGFRDLFDLNDREVRGHTDAVLFDSEMATEVRHNDNRVLETGEPVETEERIMVDGRERFYLSSKTPIYDIGTDSHPDDPVAIFGVASDITERKEREQEITRLNHLHQTVLSNIRETVVVTDDDGQFTYICPNIQFIFGYEASEVDELETVEALFSERLIDPGELEANGEVTNLETTIADKSGDSRTVLVTVRNVDIGDGSRLYSIRDITERKERQRALQEERQRFELFLDAVEEYAIFTLDPEGYVTSWNQGAERIKGYGTDEILGKHFSTFYPDERADAGYPGELLERALEEGQITDNGWRVHKDGSQFWADITITAIFDENDQHRGFVKVTKDITDRKRRERRLQRQLDRFEHFGSVLSHDLRTPLRTVEGRIELARETEEIGHLDQAKAAVERLDMLIDDLATVMREGELVDDLTALDIGECVREVWNALPTEDVTLQIRETARIRGDETAVTRLLENLLKNALDHGGDTVTVGVLTDGFYLEDNGPGIPDGIREEIFEVGYSTKCSDGEAGIGLASTRQIALAHGWQITATKGLNRGARFEITDVKFTE